MTAWENADPDRPVLVLGSAAIDTVAYPQTPLEEGVAVPAHMRTASGGVARNIAENLARLGQPVIFLSAVGRDAAGDRLLEELAALGVDVDAVLRVSDYPTGRYVGVLRPEGGLYHGFYDMRASRSLTAAYLHQHDNLFMQAAALVMDANLPKATLRTAFALARKAGLPVAADPTSPQLAVNLRRYLPRLALITPNHQEAAALLGRPLDPTRFDEVTRAARELVALGVGLAVITLAEFGLCYASSDGQGHLPALRTEILDPTGAGDALTAVVLYGLLHGFPVDDAIQLGISAASLALNAEGNVPADLSLERLYDQLVV